jgi:hypothetical protein
LAPSLTPMGPTTSLAAPGSRPSGSRHKP